MCTEHYVNTGKSKGFSRGFWFRLYLTHKVGNTRQYPLQSHLGLFFFSDRIQQIQRMWSFRKLDELMMNKLCGRLSKGSTWKNRISQLYCSLHRLVGKCQHCYCKQYLRNNWYCWLCLSPGTLTTNCELLHIYPACLCMDPPWGIPFLLVIISSAHDSCVFTCWLKPRSIWKDPAIPWWLDISRL